MASVATPYPLPLSQSLPTITFPRPGRRQEGRATTGRGGGGGGGGGFAIGATAVAAIVAIWGLPRQRPETHVCMFPPCPSPCPLAFLLAAAVSALATVASMCQWRSIQPAPPRRKSLRDGAGYDIFRTRIRVAWRARTARRPLRCTTRMRAARSALRRPGCPDASRSCNAVLVRRCPARVRFDAFGSMTVHVHSTRLSNSMMREISRAALRARPLARTPVLRVGRVLPGYAAYSCPLHRCTGLAWT